MQSLSNELDCAPNQSVTVSFFDKRLNEDVNLADEIHMLDLFDMYKEEMSCQLAVGVFESTAVGGAEELNPLVDDVDLDPDHPMGDDDLEPDRKADMFDNEEEYVGIDDENMYIPVPPSNAQPSSNAQPNDNAPLSNHIVDDVAGEGGIFFWRKR
jgi:hypothetical protein